MNEPVQLDRLRQVAPQLYDRLREMIVTIVLPPGTPLARSELAARFGVSQTPVRDALMRLQAESLVDVIPQAATRVSKIDMTKAEQTHFLRRSIELEIVRQLATPSTGANARREAAPLAAALIEKLYSILEEQGRLAGEEDYVAFSAADHAFHRELYLAAGMMELWEVVQSRSGHIDRLRRLHLPTEGKMQRVMNDHRLIVQAIEARQPEQAQQRLREHLSGTLSQVADIRSRHPEYFFA